MVIKRTNGNMLIPEEWIRKYAEDNFGRSDCMGEVIDIMLDQYAAERNTVGEYKVGYDENSKRHYKVVKGKAAALSLAAEKLETSDHISIKKTHVFKLNE